MTQPNLTQQIAEEWAFHVTQQDWDSLSDAVQYLYESDVRDMLEAIDVLGLEVVEKENTND